MMNPCVDQHRRRGSGLLLLGLLLGSLVGGHAPGTAAQPAAGIVVLIQVRDGAGRPAPGLTLTLAAPDGSAAPRQAVTDGAGQARFPDVAAGLWRVTFGGQAAGRMVQPAADQGRPPYGTDPAGGGFLLPVEPQQEDAAPTPVVVAGTPQPPVQPSGFVLLPRGADTWVVTFDLAGAGEAPQPFVTPPAPATPEGIAALPGVEETPQPLVTPPEVQPPAPSPTPAWLAAPVDPISPGVTSRIALSPLPFWIALGLVGLLAVGVWGKWRR